MLEGLLRSQALICEALAMQLGDRGREAAARELLAEAKRLRGAEPKAVMDPELFTMLREVDAFLDVAYHLIANESGAEEAEEALMIIERLSKSLRAAIAKLEDD